MESNEADIFANTLKKRVNQKQLTLYGKDKTYCRNKTKNCDVRKVILSVSKQMQALQSADNIKNYKRRNDLSVYKKSEFTPINMISFEQPSEVQTNKFETQCELDTQLFNLIQNAEALIDIPKDINKEFDITFNNLNIDNKNTDNIIVKEKGKEKETEQNIDRPNSSTKEYEHNVKDIKKNNKNSKDLVDIHNTQSKVDTNLNNSTPKTIPLVYELELFEKFETIAIPAINNNPDFKSAKKLINSQINRELFIQSHADPVLSDRDKSLSPIISIRKKPKINKKDDFHEDKLLFNSDEEDDLNKIEDLPLTCALATSFYNQHDLDKTMYVGFQTASNKSIQVQTDSYCKAKNILDNVEISEDISLTKMVKAIDSSTCDNLNDKTQFSIPKDNKNNTAMVGFKTGHGKEINISKEDLIKSKRMFKDILENDEYMKVDVNNSNKKRKLSQSDLDKAKSDIDTNEFKLIHKNSENNSLGNINKDGNQMKLMDASNEVSKHAEIISIDEQIIKEFENNFTAENTYNNKNNDVSNEGVGNIQLFEGFKTASNNKIKISEKGLAKIRNVFEDFNLNDLVEATNENKENRHNYDNFDVYNQPSTSKNFIGFKTANNNAIKISEQALAKTKHVFDNIDQENFNLVKDQITESTMNNNNPIKTVVNKNTPTTVKNKKHGFINPFPARKSDNPKIDIKVKLSEESQQNSNLDKSNFIGFQTASNKKVGISKSALVKSAKIFKEIFDNKELNIENNLNLSKEFESASNDPKTLENLINHKEHIKTFTNIGFKTASNKPVKISDDALEKSKKIFEDIAFNNIKEDSSNSSKNLQGFKTASNKPVSVSTEALVKTKNIFNDLEFKDFEDNAFKSGESNYKDVGDINVIQGFKTASNKPVRISADALSKSKKMFQDIKEEISCKSAIEGFKTASNKHVNISEEALAKTKNVFQDIIDDGMSSVNCKSFVGFQTANNKRVKISEDALAKSKKIFDGIDFNKPFNENTIADNGNKINREFGFKSANDNVVSVSEESLKVAKDFFENKEDSLKKNENNNYPLGIEDLINTEVIKNLEESFNTQDFLKDRTPVSKRSGSPILSCPKAKKRRFKTPKIINKTLIPGNTDIVKSTNKIFCENYKKNKQYTLKDIKNMESNSDLIIDENISNIKFENLLLIEFGGKRNDIDSDVWTTDRIKAYFTDSVNKKIIPEGWIDNHLKLIIWKLLSYEIFFPNFMKNVCTVKNVLFQLKYRYDRELYNVERPALSKVLEKDEVSSKMMVLCVVEFYVDGVSVSSIANPTQNIEILLTDGWYCIKACADRMIDNLIFEGRIRVGTKLAIHGAELMNCEQGISPWEDTSIVRLKIFGNSTRRARWDARLGFHGNGAILSPLSAVKADGGKVSRLRVLVTRVYPMLYVEKFEDGSTVTRSERLEHKHQMKYETDRQNQMEKLYDELEKMSDQESQDSEGFDSDKGNMESGSQIYRYMKRNNYTTDFKVNLTETQTDLLHQHAAKNREKLIEKLQKKVQDLVKKRGLDAVRNVVSLLKIRVADVNKDIISKAMITIWRPNECLLDLITEGAWLDIYNVVPTAYRLSELQISAGRQSIFQKSNYNDIKIKTHTETLKRKCYHIKELQNKITTDYNEIDTIGFVFSIETTNQFENVFLADENKNMISVNFWGGIKKFGFENILDTGQIVACVNLQSRSGNTKRHIPQYRATEFTYFTKTCKIDVIKKLTEELATKFSSINKKNFIEECVLVRNNFTNFRYGNTDTSHRLNNSDFKNRMVIESPLGNNQNINLTGIDFESIFAEDLLSQNSLLKKKKVKDKIDKLKRYGEPPPLNLIHIKNSKTIQPYKSPLLKNSDVSTNVASIKNISPNVASVNNLLENINSSPVLNRTYVKTIIPIKLNFSNNNNNDENLNTDPFAEEFDCSPPLSL